MPRDRYHHGNLRSALLDTTRHILETEGIHAVTIRRVAREVGVTHAAPYRHFESKEALVDAVLSAAVEEMEQALTQAVQSQEPGARIRECVTAYVGFAREHPTLFEAVCRWAPARAQLSAAFRALVGPCGDAVACAAHGLAVFDADANTVRALCDALAHLS